jgi:ectoine hydroxylase-related dioxygenase (phytanoyl-CoA dioxygenase family)
MKTPNLVLTPEQIEFFHREGYLSLPAITSPEEVAQLCDIYDHLFEVKAGRDQGDHLDLTSHDDDENKEPTLPQIMNPSKYAPALKDTQLRANAEAIARQLFGDQTQFRFDHAIRKPARTGSATPWHQDEAYNSPVMDYNEVSIWIPLQPATIENGCMWFVPRSHTSGILPHHPIGNDPKVIGLEVDNPEAMSKGGVACELPAGGATIHSSKTLHYTGPNVSAGPRRAYILGFGAPPTPLDEPRDFYWLEQQRTAWHERVEAASKAKAS